MTSSSDRIIFKEVHYLKLFYNSNLSEGIVVLLAAFKFGLHQGCNCHNYEVQTLYWYQIIVKINLFYIKKRI